MCVQPTSSFQEFFSRPGILSVQNGEASTFSDVCLPFEPTAVHADSFAVSYRHGGDNVWCCIEGRPDFALCINRQALLALSAAGKLGRSLWLDCLCIPLSGHDLQQAFEYMGCLYSAVSVYSQVNWIDDVDS